MKYSLFLILALSLNTVFGQHQDKMDFIRAEVQIAPIPKENRINGTVEYSFRVLQDADSVFLDAKKMDFSSVQLNGKPIDYTNTGKTVSVPTRLKAGKKYSLKLSYSCNPEQTVYFLGWNDEGDTAVAQNETSSVDLSMPSYAQIWTQGQGKYTSHWLPSFDAMEEKVEFDLSISFHEPYTVIANGILKSVKPDGTGKKTWRFDMAHPMSSYLLAFAIGDYAKQEIISDNGIHIENYFYPEDSLRAEPTFRHTRHIFDFLENEIGVPYPWQNYKQVPVRDFLYAGMENTGTTIFSDAYVIDSTAFVDKNYVNVNAHEMAHQWFGNLVTEKSGDHHWLHEGFATYYAYLAEKSIFGDEHFYWKLYDTLSQLKQQVDSGEGQSLLDPKASSLTFYEKGAWALFMLRESLGDTAFKEGIRNYLQRFQFKNVTVGDFLSEMEKASGTDSSDFKEDWLVNEGILFDEAKRILRERSPSLDLWFELEALENVRLTNPDKKNPDFTRSWNSTSSIHLKKYILLNYYDKLPQKIIKEAFASDTVPIRQTLAQTADFKRHAQLDFETLLNDESYVTIETALFKLWESFPQKRADYLSATREIVGLPNKNVRLLWLTLAMVTEGYEGRKTKAYFEELSGYTDPKYPFAVRQGAFLYLEQAFGFTDAVLLNLMEATTHHAWQFKKFARNLIKQLFKDADYRKRLRKLSNKLNDEELRYFNSIDSTE